MLKIRVGNLLTREMCALEPKSALFAFRYPEKNSRKCNAAFYVVFQKTAYFWGSFNSPINYFAAVYLLPHMKHYDVKQDWQIAAHLHGIARTAAGKDFGVECNGPLSIQ